MSKGVKGAKSGAKEHGQLVKHIENVARARTGLDKARKEHDEFVGKLYREHGGSPSDAVANRPF